MLALLRAATLVAALMVSVAEARTVRWAASGDPNTMDPHSQNVGTVTMVLQQIYDSLISRNQQLGLEPGLATAWTQEEPTRWRFTLRLYREDVPHIPLHHQMIPWAMRSTLAIPHMANNQPYFRWALVN